MSDNIHTIAVLKAKEGRLDDLKTTLKALAAETCKESGAIEYFFVHDENHDSNTIVSYKKWENAEEEARHWKTQRVGHAIEQLNNILEGEPVVHRGPKKNCLIPHQHTRLIMSKTILITGADSGLGHGTALGLARNGHKVIATVEN